jgi:hypothetical protein
VNLGQAPRSIYAAYKRGVYPVLESGAAAFAVAGLKVRLGAYGDPASVPVSVWRSLVGRSAGWTGYTHQWRRAGAGEYRGLLMASCDTLEEHAVAVAQGWRTFTVLGDGAAPPERSFECLADAKDVSCADCMACNGARDRDRQPASVWIRVHGALVNRFDAGAIGGRARRSDALRVV